MQYPKTITAEKLKVLRSLLSKSDYLDLTIEFNLSLSHVNKILTRGSFHAGVINKAVEVGIRNKNRLLQAGEELESL